MRVPSNIFCFVVYCISSKIQWGLWLQCNYFRIIYSLTSNKVFFVHCYFVKISSENLHYRFLFVCVFLFLLRGSITANARLFNCTLSRFLWSWWWGRHKWITNNKYTAQKMKFFIKDLVRKCDQIRRKRSDNIWIFLIIDQVQ